MPTLSTTPLDARAELRAAEDFVSLLCSDEAWVEAEFEAIIAAEWPSPPSEPAEPSEPVHDRPPGPGRHRIADRRGAPTGQRHPGAGGRAQERSPPGGPGPQD